MECGTSLAEREHLADDDVVDRTALATSSPPPSSSPAEAVRLLRDSIALDVVTTRSGTFVSPFDVPASSESKDSSTSSSGGRRKKETPLVYCDQTASNRALKSIEAYISDVCLPLYGNTHTNTSVTGSQSTAFVAEARQIVAEGTNSKVTGKASLDVVLFTGSGATSAVELLIDCMGLKSAARDCPSPDCRPIVFVGPYEHHSNLIPWRESGCEIVMVPECPASADVDYDALEALLDRPEYAPSSGRLRMGTFAAASNVTGKVSDVDRIAAALHRRGALAFFDYATAASSVPVDVNPPPLARHGSDPALVAKDAVFVSPHKMIGGIGSPGVLVVKKHLVDRLNAPGRSGGGTVFYVTHDDHRFLSNRIERYEGGTPNVVGAYRAGLAFLVKREAGEQYRRIVAGQAEAADGADLKSADVADRMDFDDEDSATGTPPPLSAAGLPGPVPRTALEYEFRTHDYVVSRLRRTAPNLVMLGTANANPNGAHGAGGSPDHLPIFSFLIRAGRRFLHYNYVCAILNDLFGVQSRGGCQCSGPYSQRLLGLTVVDPATGLERPSGPNRRVEGALLRHKERAELLRPGYTRLSLPFKGLRAAEVEYALRAIEWVARNGWALLPLYRCNHRTGEWRHHARQGRPLGRTERRWLSRYGLGYARAGIGGEAEGATDLASITAAATAEVDTRSQDGLLQAALDNADAVLEAARADPTHVSKAFAMSDANGILGGDEMEDLRWYVYPRECAALLRAGTVGLFPESDTGDVLGALRPRGFFPPAKEEAGVTAAKAPSVEPPSSAEQPHDGAKPAAAVDDTVSVSEAVGSSSPSAKQPHDGATATFLFRDGEHHSGEAPLEDVEAGYHDGELGDCCEVFSPKTDAWVPIERFLASCRKKAKKEDSAPFPPSDNAEMQDEEKKEATPEKGTGGVVGARPRSAVAAPAPEIVAVSAVGEAGKSERKKPSRGSSAWGQSCVPRPAVQVSSATAQVDAALRSRDEGEDEKVPEEDASATMSADAAAKARPSPSAASLTVVRKKGRIKPPPKMMRLITQAMIQWQMVEEGDRLLLGLSGGKDSLSLLHILLEFQRKLPINFDIEVCTVDPMTPSFDPSPLIPYVESLGLKYHYEKHDIVSRASTAGRGGGTVSSLCSFCARMKRGILYNTARKSGCNKLVLAQHLDDCAESFLMSVMHNGFLRTMKANYRINAGDISVIRPLVYCREGLMTEFAKAAHLPVVNENCPACFEEPKERDRMKKLLSREETLFPNIYDNLRRSLIPLMHDDLTAIMRCYTEEAVARSRKVNMPKGKGRKKGRGQRGDGEKTEENAVADIKDEELGKTLVEATDEELVKELARRKAERYKLSGAMKRLGGDGDDEDPTGQMCSLKGG